MPSLLRRAANYATAVATHVATGGGERSPAMIRALLPICQACPHYNHEAAGCAKCGCSISKQQSALNNALAMPSKSCPVGKWGPESFATVHWANDGLEPYLDNLDLADLAALHESGGPQDDRAELLSALYQRRSPRGWRLIETTPAGQVWFREPSNSPSPARNSSGSMA